MEIPKVIINTTADIWPPSQQVEEEMEKPEEEQTLPVFSCLLPCARTQADLGDMHFLNRRH